MSKASEGKISIRVTSGIPKGRTILIDVDNSVLPISNLGDLVVLYDNEPIPMADGYSDVLDPTDDNSPEYLAVLGKEGIQVLVSVPKFSTHEIVIAKKAVPEEVFVPWILLISGIVVAISIGIGSILWSKRPKSKERKLKSRRRTKRKKGSRR